MKTKNERRKIIKGIKVARSAPALSNMFFTDDYCQANGETTTEVLNMLRVYEIASGQKLNAAKLSILFSHNMK